MKIGIDIDDVLAAFNAGFVEFYNKTFGTNYKFDDFKDYDYSKTYTNITPEMAMERVFQYVNSPDFDNVKPIVGSQAGIESLKDNQLFVITSRSTDIKDHTLRWLSSHFDGFEDVIFTNSFTQNPNLKAEKKSEAGKRLGITHMVEDAPHHAEDLAANGIKVILLERPWNEWLEGNDMILKAKTWDDVLKHLKA